MAIYAIKGRNGECVIRAKNGVRALEIYGDAGAEIARIDEHGAEGVVFGEMKAPSRSRSRAAAIDETESESDA